MCMSRGGGRAGYASSIHEDAPHVCSASSIDENASCVQSQKSLRPHGCHTLDGFLPGSTYWEGLGLTPPSCRRLPCLPACLSVCLPACPVCLPACLPACLAACRACLPACLPAGVVDRRRASATSCSASPCATSNSSGTSRPGTTYRQAGTSAGLDRTRSIGLIKAPSVNMLTQ